MDIALVGQIDETLGQITEKLIQAERIRAFIRHDAGKIGKLELGIGGKDLLKIGELGEGSGNEKGKLLILQGRGMGIEK
jgi:hypothetical protein